MGQISHLTPADVASPLSDEDPTEAGCPGAGSDECQEVPFVVDQGSQLMPGEEVCDTTRGPAVYRCQSPGLGSYAVVILRTGILHRSHGYYYGIQKTID